MGLLEEMKLSVCTLNVAGYHTCADRKRIAQILLGVYGRRQLAPFLLNNPEADNDAVLHELEQRLYHNCFSY